MSEEFGKLKELLEYDRVTGVFRWRVSRGKARVGKVAGTKHSHGYISIALFGKRYYAHRLAWLFTHGEWPDGDIDHINGDCDDNRMENLRARTHSDNMRNMQRNKSNTSGVCGVSWHKQAERWEAYIHGDGKRLRLGLFRDFDAAVAARQAAEETIGYDPMHGAMPQERLARPLV